jgi:hypothetical protein
MSIIPLGCVDWIVGIEKKNLKPELAGVAYIATNRVI